MSLAEDGYPAKDKDFPFVDLREGARGFFIWAPMNGDKLEPSALELIGEANRQKEKLDEDSRTIYSVIIGKNPEIYTDTLIHHGADVVYVIKDERLEYYQTLPYTKALIAAIKDINPEVALFSASTLGRDMAPRIAAIMNCGLSADCTEFDVGYYASRRNKHRFKKVFKMIRPSFGESKLATIIGPWNYPQMATARPGVFKPLEADTSRTGKVVNFDVEFEDADFAIKVLENIQNDAKLDLTKADVIVAGGLGVGKDGFPILMQLVEAIRANGQRCELGASRAAVDAGFIPYEHQVGQTGKTVRPTIYIAVGISGAVQHLAGMKESKKIIAINNDPHANIFQSADFGIVADYQEVLPDLIKSVKDGYTFTI